MPTPRYVVAFRSLGMVEAVAPLDSLHPASDVDPTFAVPLDAVDSLVERVDEAMTSFLCASAAPFEASVREARSKAVRNWEPAPGEVRSNSCLRVEIRFVVDTLGVPERGTVSLTSTNNGGFGAAFVALVPDLRFTPARRTGRPVRQVMTCKESVGASRASTAGSASGRPRLHGARAADGRVGPSAPAARSVERHCRFTAARPQAPAATDPPAGRRS